MFILDSFDTDRLNMKRTTEIDAPFIFELMNTPKFIQNIGDRNVKSITDARQYIKEKMTPQYTKLGYSNYTITRKSDAVKLGTCGLYDREGLEGIDIGFAFLPEHERQGYAFESSNALKNIAMSKLGIKKLRAITLAENASSIQLLEKLGLQFQEKIKLPNDDEELCLFQLGCD